MQWIDLLKTCINRLRPGSAIWSGDYTNWEQAAVHCTGYDAANILEKVKQAVLKVKNGQAVYERDSVLFDEIEYSWPLLAGLMWIAARNDGKLHVCDFGGSLGSSYFQNRKFLQELTTVAWSVLEQDSFVATGKEYIQDDTLRFFADMNECMQIGTPDVLLLSAVLPYIARPYDLLEQLMQYNIPYVIIDNTYFNYRSRDRICIQRVQPEIYDASYPCWFLDYNTVKTVMTKKYHILAEHLNESVILLDGRKIRYKGMLLKKAE